MCCGDNPLIFYRHADNESKSKFSLLRGVYLVDLVCGILGVLKGVMRVGAFARGLLLKGECNVELILMTATKPNLLLFNNLTAKLPEKFEVCVKMLYSANHFTKEVVFFTCD